MGYQALLLCPDEKLARIVTQLFSELEFTVSPVQDQFAAVKSIMAQHYDAIVVDCENEQNAALVLKSARDSSFNQRSLVIGLVEGQAGVARAYRMGVNLVLTKPINVDQAKGTLRVARGLLRKSADSPAPLVTSPSVTVQASQAAASTMQPVETQSSEPHAQPVVAASSKIIEPLKANASGAVSANASAPNVVNGSQSAGVAVAPAKEIALPKTESTDKEQGVWEEIEPSSQPPAQVSSPASDLTKTIPLTFIDDKNAGGSGGSRKILIAIAVVVLVAVAYVGWGKFGRTKATPIGQPATTAAQSAVRTDANRNSNPNLTPAPQITPSSAISNRASTATGIGAPKTSDTQSERSGNSASAAKIPSSPEAEENNSASVSIHVKSEATPAKAPAADEETTAQLPSPLGVASASATGLSGLLAPPAARPALTRIRVSQGVSQGMLIKRVQPKYPANALAMRAHGAVQIEATVDKQGNVVSPRVLSGDPVLAAAALEAVRQWRYKPYYLDGEPVEIQTEITINFRNQ